MQGPATSSSRRWKLRRPSNLAFDFLDVLRNFGRCGLCLLALDSDERGLVLLIGKPDLEGAVGEQRNSDHGGGYELRPSDSRIKIMDCPKIPLLRQNCLTLQRWRLA